MPPAESGFFPFVRQGIRRRFFPTGTFSFKEPAGFIFPVRDEVRSYLCTDILSGSPESFIRRGQVELQQFHIVGTLRPKNTVFHIDCRQRIVTPGQVTTDNAGNMNIDTACNKPFGKSNHILLHLEQQAVEGYNSIRTCFFTKLFYRFGSQLFIHQMFTIPAGSVMIKQDIIKERDIDNRFPQ